MADKSLKPIDIVELSGTPSLPSSGYQRVYPKSDGKIYALTSSGVETDLTATGSGGLTITNIEKQVCTVPRRSGNFQITGLTGLTAGKQVILTQAVGPYTGKGTRVDEAEMETIVAKAYVLNSTTIQVYWNSPMYVKGNYKFNYFIQS